MYQFSACNAKTQSNNTAIIAGQQSLQLQQMRKSPKETAMDTGTGRKFAYPHKASDKQRSPAKDSFTSIANP